MQGFSRAVDESNSNSVWNSAILFCTSSLNRLRPSIGYSWGDGGRRLLQHRNNPRKNSTIKKQKIVHNISVQNRYYFFHFLAYTIRAYAAQMIRKCLRSCLEISQSGNKSFVHEKRGKNHLPGICVIRFQLEEIPLKGILVLEFHAKDNSMLIYIPWNFQTPTGKKDLKHRNSSSSIFLSRYYLIHANMNLYEENVQYLFDLINNGSSFHCLPKHQQFPNLNWKKKKHYYTLFFLL